MNCPKCNMLNDDTNVFCINCGETFLSSGNLPPTLLSSENVSETAKPTEVFQYPVNQKNEQSSDPTVFAPYPNFNQSNAQYNPSTAGFNPSIQYVPPQPEPKSRLGLWICLAVLVILLLGGGIVAGILFLYQPTTPISAETLPDHLGMFFQNNEKTSVEEIKKKDFTNALEGKDKLLKDESMPAVESKPNLILYSDGKDIPLNDLKLIQLDSIKADGAMKQIDFKATPVEGKPEMKRLWFTENLAKGKYAFAIIDGYFDDGKHKFWVFQVKNSDKTDNVNLAKETTVSIKGKLNSSNNSNTTTNTANTQVTPTPKPAFVPPVGSRTAYADTNNVVVRSAPSLDAKKVNGLKRGQKVYVVGYSENYDYWNGLEGNWANVVTESGQRGWVFSPLIRY
jgi:Bacterial SH3 domain